MKNPIKNMVWKNYPEGNVTQWFAENPALYGQFGLAGHNGIDIVAPWGTPILATTTQKVVEVKLDEGGYGRHVRCIDGEREYVYGHLSKISVVLGQELKEGEQLGLMGNTGFVVSGATPYWKYNPYAGTHLHYGERMTRSTEPFNIFYATGDKRFILNYENGYLGSVDPSVRFLPAESPEEKIKGLLTVVSLKNQLIALYKRLRELKGRAPA